MFRLLLVVICFTGILAGPIEGGQNQLSANIKIVDDIAEFQKQNPHLEYTRFEKNSLTKGVIRYTVGGRVNGDKLVAQASDAAQWASPQNVQLVLRYPNSGTGQIVSFAEIIVDQSSNLGDGYIIGGGVGQRTITILIEARSTTYFRYAASVYGY